MVKVDSSKAYRYVRYYGLAGGYGNISEAGFYSSVNDTVPLAGKVLGPEEGAVGDHSYFNVFDGHTDTSYDYPFADGGGPDLTLADGSILGRLFIRPVIGIILSVKEIRMSFWFAVRVHGFRLSGKRLRPIPYFSRECRNMRFCCFAT